MNVSCMRTVILRRFNFGFFKKLHFVLCHTRHHIRFLYFEYFQSTNLQQYCQYLCSVYLWVATNLHHGQELIFNYKSI